MNKRIFQQLLLDGDFKELFISELGWNKWKVRAELLPISIDGTDYLSEPLPTATDCKLS